MKVAPNCMAFAAMRKWQTQDFFFFFPRLLADLRLRRLKSVFSREINIEWVAKLAESVPTGPIDFKGDFFLRRESDATARRDKID